MIIIPVEKKASECGMTLTTVSDKTGISEKDLMRLNSGNFNAIRQETLISLRNILNCDLCDLIEEV